VPDPRVVTLARRIAGVLAALGLAVWLASRVTTPLPEHLTTHLPGTAFMDVLYAAWTLAWQTHALVTAPGALGQPNIYQPTPDALFYGPLATGLLPVFAPVWLSTGNAALALNVALIGSLALSGTAVHLAVAWWTGSWIAGAAGSAALLLTPFLYETGKLAPQWATLEFFPVLLLAAARVRSWGRAVLVGALVAMQAAAEIVYFAPVAFGTLGLWTLLRLRRRDTRPEGVRLVAACVVGIALLLPALTGFARVAAANPALRAQTPWGWGDGAPLPGVVATHRPPRLAALVQAATPLPLVPLGWMAWAWARRRGAARAPSDAWVLSALLVAVPAVGALCLPTAQALLAGTADTLGVIREPARLMFGGIVGVALLMGLATAGLRDLAGCWMGGRAGSAVAALAVAACLLAGRTLSPEPMGVAPAPNPSPMELVVLRMHAGPVLEIPATGRIAAGARHNAQAMYRSTFHWRPLLNGYASYWPATWPARVALTRRLPDDAEALSALVRETGVTTIVVHLGDVEQPERERWMAAYRTPPRGLRPQLAANDVLLFGVTPATGGPPT
jgi:hypothetical protein